MVILYQLTKILLMLVCIAVLVGLIILGWKGFELIDYVKTKKTIVLQSSMYRGNNKLNTNKLEYTMALLAAIDLIAEIEVQYYIMQYKNINKRIEIFTIDNTIKDISENIFDGLKVSSYDNEMVILKEDYIMKYIVNILTKKMVEDVTKHNDKIYVGEG